MNSPTEFLRVAVPAAIKAGKEIMRIYGTPSDEWEIEHKSDDSPLTKADKIANDVIVEALRPTNIPVLSEESLCAPYDERKDWQQLWVVDPLDGTKEFIKRNDEFTVNIALVEEGNPIAGVIYMPAKRTLYFGFVGFGAFRLGDVTVAKDEVQMMRSAARLPMDGHDKSYTVVASRSHINPETEKFIEDLRVKHPDLQLLSAGSSIKLCKVVEGSADVYPRLAPTMEWDTAAGDAIARAGGCQVLNVATGEPLKYNKKDLNNPYFVVLSKEHDSLQK